MSDNKKPVSKITLHPVTAAIWKNQNGDGKVFYSVTFERSYRDEAGNWKSSDNYSVGELLLLAKVADLAHTEIFKLRANDRQTQQSGE